ncbi:GrpB family protein [Aquimarina sp. MMG016]|uniref:GrpB family protein n=1 Tax=Aquimarina sp. MMG016 TaxID=2822690 RepID=UPI001B3A62D7|nr:GrpB family protein [Aquimarina sp. MMG016]MBQ4821207.1 GrpB family protein [Aquimarina sp. MMG016]
MKKTLQDLTPEEWGKLFPIEISDYKPEWPNTFLLEKEKIKNIISSKIILRIEHFGSTSIPNLPSKDSIDILIAIPKEKLFSNSIVEKMKSIGYDFFKQEGFGQDYMIFAKGFSLDHKKEQQFFIHMTTVDHEDLWDRIYFRDYLRQHPDIAKDYASLKYELAQKFHNHRVNYRIGKGEFVKYITQIAKSALE